jgi:glycylpeptide N-tetradecanoyltransferase
VHKKLRAKRLAPVLIKEITRRVNLRDIWQAVYTAGVVLPKAVAQNRYYHRSLNPKKLIDIGFSRLHRNMTMLRTIKLYKVPDTPQLPGFRPLVAADVPEVTRLLNGYLNKCQLAPVFDEDEVAHWLTPRAGVVDSYVVAEQKANGSQGPITDLCSFYHLPSTVIGHATHNQMKAAYSFYNVPRVPTEERWTQLMGDALVAAKNLHMDVFNALNVMDNERFLKVLKFGEGDGHLQYYLYNWRVSRGALARTTSTRTHACFHFASTAGLVHAVFGKAHICWLSSACVCMCVSARP